MGSLGSSEKKPFIVEQHNLVEVFEESKVTTKIQILDEKFCS